MRRPGQHGVALLEVLLSVSLLGLSIGVSVQAVSVATRAQSRLNEQTTARRLIDEALIEVQLGPGGARAARGEGAGGVLAWTADVRAGSEEMPFRYVFVTVTKKDAPIASYRGFI
jgi:type II secretion system protein I